MIGTGTSGWRVQIAAWGALGVAGALCVGLVLARVHYAQALAYRFLLWNLFLAYVPVVFAQVLVQRAEHGDAWVWGGLWLLFFPNAPYLLTDFVHLGLNAWADVPLWYDVLMFFAFAGAGLLASLMSLARVHGVVRRWWGASLGWGAVTLACTLAGFGVYLGRFQRWNSWDVFVDPVAVVLDTVHLLAHPVRNISAYGFAGVIALLLLTLYVSAWAAGQGALAEARARDWWEI